MDWLIKGEFEIIILQTISYSNCRRIGAERGSEVNSWISRE